MGGRLERGFALIDPAVTKQFGIPGWKGTYKPKTFLLNSKMGNLTTKRPGGAFRVSGRRARQLPPQEPRGRPTGLRFVTGTSAHDSL